MVKKLTKTEIVNLVLEEDKNNISDNEDIIHLLLDKTIAKDINNTHKKALSFGARVSDRMAAIAGSWSFIILFCSILFLWVVLNAIILFRPFDPYPFILLNLVLSCIAAIQAPIIMMSQNRQEQKDRIRADNDYKVNLKSELILEDLHSKIDQLMSSQENIIARLDAADNSKN